MDKKSLIQQIEQLRNSRVITYLTSDRSGPVNARVAMDIIPVISKQLREMGKAKNIDLNAVADFGETPLHQATKVGKTFIIKWLIENSCQVNCTNK